MRIETNSYKVAPLEPTEEAVHVIQLAEEKLLELTGSPVTLIAYEKTKDSMSTN